MKPIDKYFTFVASFALTYVLLFAVAALSSLFINHDRASDLVNVRVFNRDGSLMEVITNVTDVRSDGFGFWFTDGTNLPTYVWCAPAGWTFQVAKR